MNTEILTRGVLHLRITDSTDNRCNTENFFLVSNNETNHPWIIPTGLLPQNMAHFTDFFIIQVKSCIDSISCNVDIGICIIEHFQGQSIGVEN